MPFNRRCLMKMLAATSCIVASQSTRTNFLRAMIQPPQHTVSLFFHGFFFFDVQKDALVVGAPYYKYHNFLHRDQGANRLDPIPKIAQNLTTDLAGQQTMLKWPTEILNFPKANIMDDVVPRTWSSDLGCLLILPFPLAIEGKRDGGDIGDCSLSGNIAPLIKKASGPALKLITRLEYKSSTRKNHHFHAEHCDIPNDDEMKEMLDAARNAFDGKFKKNFDLQMTGIPYTSASTASIDDEKNLSDLAGMSGNPCLPLPKPLGLGGSRAATHKPSRQTGHKMEPRLVRTANCPMFAMT